MQAQDHAHERGLARQQAEAQAKQSAQDAEQQSQQSAQDAEQADLDGRALDRRF